MNKSKMILFIILVQTLFLIGLIAKQEYTLTSGTPIILETSPVDPRSLFSGDYVQLNYKISDLNLEKLQGDKDFKFQQDVYVVLEPQGEYWVAVGAYHHKPQVVPPQQIIKGKAVANPLDGEGGKSLRVWYGIEQYFLPEGEGKKLESGIGQKQMKVKVAVDTFGFAAIQGILWGDKELYQESLF